MVPVHHSCDPPGKAEWGEYIHHYYKKNPALKVDDMVIMFMIPESNWQDEEVQWVSYDCGHHAVQDWKNTVITFNNIEK